MSKYGCRIIELTTHFKRLRIDWRKAGGVMAKELQALMNSTDIIVPENQTNPHGVALSDTQNIRYLESLEHEKKFYVE